MFGISGSEFLVLAVIAALVLGPKNVAQGLTALQFPRLVSKAATRNFRGFCGAYSRGPRKPESFAESKPFQL